MSALPRSAAPVLLCFDGSEDAAAAIAAAGEVLAPGKRRSRVAGGKAWRKICDIAAELDATVIVLGARGLGRVEAALLGSVSSAVVLHAKRPVLAVPHQSDG